MADYLRIPNFTNRQQFVDSDGRLDSAAQTALNRAFQQIEAAVNAIADIPAIQDALANLDAATAAAQAAADNANMAADTVSASSALANSYVSGLTISAADAGTDVTVTISNHTRTYATTPPTDVAVTGDTLTGVPYSSPGNETIYIYYDQPSRAGGAVSYQYSFDNSDVAQIGDRHSVGAAALPEAGDPVRPGKPITPPGGSYDLALTT